MFERQPERDFTHRFLNLDSVDPDFVCLVFEALIERELVVVLDVFCWRLL